MAKNSAKSKGYRKNQTAKKPYLSKKEITVTAVVAGIIILAFALFIGLYDDGALKLSDGSVATDGSNSLVVNAGTGYNPRYYKIGQLTDIEGYTLSSAPMGADENVLEYVYTPNGESPIDSITINTYALDAATYAASAEHSYTINSETPCDGLQTTEDDGHAVSYLTFRVIPTEDTIPDNILATAVEELIKEAQSEADEEALTELAEESEPALVQALHGYVDAGENRLIYVLVRNDVETVEEYVDDAALTDAFNQVLAALSYETK